MDTCCKATLRSATLTAVAIFLTSCAWMPKQTLCVEYTVAEGDTIYRIAQAFSMDWRAVATTNAINDPYLIRPGETLYLCENDEQVLPDPLEEQVTDGVVVADSGSSSKSTIEWWDIEIEKRSSRASVSIPATATTAPAPVISPTPPPKVPSSVPTSPKPSPQATTPSSPKPANRPLKPGWQWPVSARPRRGYSATNEGIEYFLNQGTVVVAARSGKVEYFGVGLSGGYKYMIIVRDADRYDTVYEFNVEPLIEQHDTVDRGEALFRIEKGALDTDQYRHFHFQIRRSGRPQDPNRVIAS